MKNIFVIIIIIVLIYLYYTYSGSSYANPKKKIMKFTVAPPIIRLKPEEFSDDISSHYSTVADPFAKAIGLS